MVFVSGNWQLLVDGTGTTYPKATILVKNVSLLMHG